MPFKKGNQLSKGHGRRGIAEELADYEELRKTWKDPKKADQILRRVQNGDGSLEDVFFAMGFKEDVKILVEIFKKIYPDLKRDSLDITSNGEPIQPLLVRILNEKGDGDTGGI